MTPGGPKRCSKCGKPFRIPAWLAKELHTAIVCVRCEKDA